jgi:hypothetical protein
MGRRASRRSLVAVALGLALGAGCAGTTATPENVQRAIEGPRADEVWMSRFAASYGRVPTFTETLTWKDAFDERVGAYLTRHPDLLTSPRASQFRFERRVYVGMTKEEVLLLLDPPLAVTSEEAAMSEAAKQFWPEIKTRAQEMWTYPAGWRLYFAGDRLVDATVSGHAPLE